MCIIVPSTSTLNSNVCVDALRILPFQIDVVSDLPVGLNLQNHVAVRGIDGAINETSLLEIPSLNDMKGLMEWHKFGKGPFTSPFGTHLGVGFFRMNESDLVPDVEIMLQGLRDDATGCAGLVGQIKL